jgi:peroxiredoxin
MRQVRILKAQEKPYQIDASKVSEVSLIDIPLIDNKGKRRSLTELKGKVVLLDFHVFASDYSTERIMMLRDLYNKYHAQGLQIYQVSFDSNEHFWKTQTAALPWICVRDNKGLQSEYLLRYFVQQLPSYFLIDRTNSLYKRGEQIDDVEAEIKTLLNK